MFDNIGTKIKGLAYAVCGVGIVCSIVGGLIIMGLNEYFKLYGILSMAMGCLGSWVGSFAIYGLGQLIENTDQLVSYAKKADDDKLRQRSKPVSEKKKHFNDEPISKDFINEIKNTSTADLHLILEDQTDLYSTKEIILIKHELSKRQADYNLSER